MYKSVNDYLVSIEGCIRIPNGGTAFPPQKIQQVFDAVLENRWIILGGDVLTPTFDYTYDNWYYKPNVKIPLLDNTIESVQRSSQFIATYRERHGENFLLAFVISNSYV